MPRLAKPGATVGMQAVTRGFALARAPGLRSFVWLPVLTSFGVIAVLLAIGYGYVQDSVRWIVSLVPEWLSFIEVVLAPLFYLVGILAGGWLFGLIAAVVASPFLGVLASRAERLEFGDGPQLDEGLWRAVGSALGRELVKLGYHIPRLIFIVLVGLILSPIAPVLWFGFGAWIAAIQFVDYAAENRGLPFAETLSLARANRAPTLVFGAATAFMLSIPLLNVIVIPAAVCGGSVLWRRLRDD